MTSRYPILLSATALASLAACSTYPPGPVRVGASEAQAVQALGAPSARHGLPSGTRLEYATGPAGRETWMLDLDAQGRVQKIEQVLTDAQLRAWQTRLAAERITTGQLLAGLGTPSHRRPGGRHEGQVWSWRYATFDCLWFQVLVDDAGRAHSGAFAPDPACDVRGDELD
jgi:hypothetical protein